MANFTYALLPTEVLMVNPAPWHPEQSAQKRVEFSPAEIRQAVEAGTILARESTDFGDNQGKCLHL